MGKRRNFLPAFALAITLLTLAVCFLIFTSPSSNNVIIAFFLSLFFGVFLLSSLLVGNTRRGFLVSFGLCAFLALRLLHLGNVLNLFLLAGLILSIEIFFSKARQ